MRHLQSYALYEVQSSVKKIFTEALTQTVAGRDLAALAYAYTVDYKGRLILRGLNVDKTYVELKDPSSGACFSYIKQGSKKKELVEYQSLEECFRDLWRDYILNESGHVLRPKDMARWEYQRFIYGKISKLEGRALNRQALSEKIDRMLVQYSANRIKAPGELIVPKWTPVLNLLGLREVQDDFNSQTSQTYQILGDNSPLTLLFVPPGDFEKHPDLKNPLTGPCTNLKITIRVIANLYDGDPGYGYFRVDIGGVTHRIPEYAERIWGVDIPLFLRRKHAYLPYASKFPWIDPLLQTAASLLEEVGNGASSDETDQLLLDLMMKKDPLPFSTAGAIQKASPRLWQKFLDSHPDPGYYQHSGILGDFGF